MVTTAATASLAVMCEDDRCSDLVGIRHAGVSHCWRHWDCGRDVHYRHNHPRRRNDRGDLPSTFYVASATLSNIGGIDLASTVLATSASGQATITIVNTDAVPGRSPSHSMGSRIQVEVTFAKSFECVAATDKMLRRPGHNIELLDPH